MDTFFSLHLNLIMGSPFIQKHTAPWLNINLLIDYLLRPKENVGGFMLFHTKLHLFVNHVIILKLKTKFLFDLSCY